MHSHRSSGLIIAAALLCSAWAARAVELDTMCMIQDTAELYQIAQGVGASIGVTVLSYSATGTCDTATMTLTIEGSPWPIPW